MNLLKGSRFWFLNTLEKEKSELVLKIITARNRMNKYNKEYNIITIS